MAQPSLSTTYDQQRIVPAVGMYAQPYGKVWPELVDQLKTLYRDKLADVDWLPPGWWATVDGLMFGRVYLTDNWHADDAAPHLEAAVVRKAARLRRALAKWDAAVETFAAGKAEEGKVLLAAAYDDAAFWNRAYSIAVVLASPVTAVRAVADVVANAPKLSALVGLAAILGLGFLVFRRR